MFHSSICCRRFGNIRAGKSSTRALALLLLTAPWVAPLVRAQQNLTWDNLANDNVTVPANLNFTTDANWVGDPAVATNDTGTVLNFGATAWGGSRTGVGAGNFFDVLTMNFTGASTSGSTTVNGGNLGQLRFANGATVTQNVQSSVQYGTVNGTLLFNGTSTNSNNFIENFSGNGTITKAGTSSINWQNNANFNGTLIHQGGILVFAGTDWNPVGASFEVQGGTIQARSGNLGTGANVAVSITGNFTFGGSNANELNGSGITLGGTGTVRTISIGNTVTNTLGGVISGTGMGLTIARTGTNSGNVTLNKVNAFTGATTVTSGVLILSSVGAVNTSSGIQVNGGTFRHNSTTAISTSLTVEASGTLDGTGAGGISGATVVNGVSTYSGEFTGSLRGTGTFNTNILDVGATGSLSPGVLAGDAGSMNITAGLTLDGTYRWNLNANSISGAGVNYDLLNVTGGNLVLGEASILDLSFGAGSDPLSGDPFWSTDQSWIIVDFSGAGTSTNNFATLQNSTFANGSFSTANQGGDVILQWTAIPEASSSLLALATISFGLFARRRRVTGSLLCIR